MTRTAACHPDKRYAARGLCWTCYQALRRTGSLPAVYELPTAGDAPPLDPDKPCCDICADDEVKLIRFALVATAKRPDGRQTTRGAGGITLCQQCWQHLRRRPAKRGPRRLRAVA